MKIAIVSEDTKDVSLHFGRAAYYVVCTIENGQLIRKEIRKKPCHQRGSCAETGPCVAKGAGIGDSSTHTYMLSAIADCQILVCGGMGRGVYYDLKYIGIQPLATELPSVDEVVADYIEGKLFHLPDRVH